MVLPVLPAHALPHGSASAAPAWVQPAGDVEEGGGERGGGGGGGRLDGGGRARAAQGEQQQEEQGKEGDGLHGRRGWRRHPGREKTVRICKTFFFSRQQVHFQQVGEIGKRDLSEKCAFT